MKVSAPTLAAVMALVGQTVNDKNTVTLTPGENAMTLTSISSLGSTRARILAVTDEDESIDACAVPSQLLAALASGGSSDIIELKPAGANMLAATAGAANTSLATKEPTDAPALDPAKAPAERTTFSMPLSVLAGGIGRVAYAAARKDTLNPAHGMVQFTIADGTLSTAALNGHQLAHASTVIPGWEGDPVNLLFPPNKRLAHLLTLAPEATAHVMIANNKILVAVKTEAIAAEVVLNTADVAYPNWQSLMTALKPTIVAVAKTKALRDMLARAMAICPTPRIGVKVEGSQLILGAKNETVQHVDALALEMPVKSIGADGKAADLAKPFVIYTAPGHILDALNATLEWANAATVRLGFIDPTKPFVINAVGYQYNHWVWPMVGGETTKPKTEE